MRWNDLTANRSVKRDDDDSLPRVDELTMAAPLALEHPAQPGHCTKEAAPVNLSGQEHHSNVHGHEFRSDADWPGGFRGPGGVF